MCADEWLTVHGMRLIVIGVDVEGVFRSETASHQLGHRSGHKAAETHFMEVLRAVNAGNFDKDWKLLILFGL